MYRSNIIHIYILPDRKQQSSKLKVKTIFSHVYLHISIKICNRKKKINYRLGVYVKIHEFFSCCLREIWFILVGSVAIINAEPK